AVLKRNYLAQLSPVADRVDADFLRYQMPGLMIEDIYRQLGAHEAGARISDVLEGANRVRLKLGYPPLVAPVRQVTASQSAYLREEKPAAPKKAAAAAPAAPSDPPPPATPPSPPPPQPAPAAAAQSTAEFEVEVEGEVFKVRVTGAGMAVIPATSAGAAASPSAPAAARAGDGTV